MVSRERKPLATGWRSRLTLSPSKSKWARKSMASFTGTSSFLYKIWKTRLCTALSWTQAECRLLLSANRRKSVEGHELPNYPENTVPSGFFLALGILWLKPAFEFPKLKITWEWVPRHGNICVHWSKLSLKRTVFNVFYISRFWQSNSCCKQYSHQEVSACKIPHLITGQFYESFHLHPGNKVWWMS